MVKPFEIGISLSSSLVADRPATAAAMMIERASMAYASGLSSLSVGDHHAQPKWYQQNTPILGRLLAEWPDRRAGCLFLVPLWPPLLMAEHIATLAGLVDAPFIVQVGIGNGAGQFAALGKSLKNRGRHTDEAIGVVKALLAGETVESELLGMGPAAINPIPEHNIEWWIGGHAPAALWRAAKQGDVWYAGPGGASAAQQGLSAYRQAASQAGTTPKAIIRRDVLALADGDRARSEAERILNTGYRGLTMDSVLVGNPDEIAAQVMGLLDLADPEGEPNGFDGLNIRCISPNQADALETIAIFGEVGLSLAAEASSD